MNNHGRPNLATAAFLCFYSVVVAGLACAAVYLGTLAGPPPG